MMLLDLLVLSTACESQKCAAGKTVAFHQKLKSICSSPPIVFWSIGSPLTA